MKLTDRILMSHLREQFAFQAEKNIGAAGKVRGPLLYEQGEIPEAGWVYVASSPAVLEGESRPPKASFWIFMRGKEEDLPEECASVLLKEEQELSVLFNGVLKAYDYYESWEERLREIQMEQGRIEDLLQASLPVIGNPVMVMGMDFTLHALASVTPLPKEYRIFEPGKEQMDYVNALIQDTQFNETREAEGIFWLPDYVTGFRSINLNIRQEGRTTHRLVIMEYRKDLSEADGDLLEILGKYVRYFLQNKTSGTSSKDKNLQRLFQRILSDRTLDYMEASQGLGNLGWQRDHEYLCLVYKVTYLDQRNLTSNAICNYMEEHFQACCSFTFQEDIVTFFDLTLMETDEETVAGKLTHFIRDSFLKAGYSRVMRGHLNLRRQYIQSCLALDVGSRKKPYLWIHYFNQIAMTYILEQTTRKLPGNMLCHEKLLVLKEMDEQHGTEYMKTLRAYLDHHQNVVQSAKELYIHRSTFLYRLDKIKAILESDLEDTEELLYLNLSFRLLEQENEKN